MSEPRAPMRDPVLARIAQLGSAALLIRSFWLDGEKAALMLLGVLLSIVIYLLASDRRRN